MQGAFREGGDMVATVLDRPILHAAPKNNYYRPLLH